MKLNKNQLTKISLKPKWFVIFIESQNHRKSIQFPFVDWSPFVWRHSQAHHTHTIKRWYITIEIQGKSSALFGKVSVHRSPSVAHAHVRVRRKTVHNRRDTAVTTNCVAQLLFSICFTFRQFTRRSTSEWISLCAFCVPSETKEKQTEYPIRSKLLFFYDKLEASNTKMGCGMSLVKYILFIFNLLCAVSRRINN